MHKVHAYGPPQRAVVHATCNAAVRGDRAGMREVELACGPRGEARGRSPVPQVTSLHATWGLVTQPLPRRASK